MSDSIFEWRDTGGSEPAHILVSKNGGSVGAINDGGTFGWYGWADGDRDSYGSRRLVYGDDVDTAKAAVAERAEAVALRRERARYCDCGATIRHDEWTGERWCPNCG